MLTLLPSPPLVRPSRLSPSLLTLSNVISKLSDPTLSSTHIPYRDSKLTRYLQPALSGKSRVAVICTISPDEKQAIETLSTLKFARRAGKVVTKAERGVVSRLAALVSCSLAFARARADSRL